MRIVCCVKRDLLGNIALNRLAKHLERHELTFLLSDKVMPEERTPGPPADQLFFERDLPIDHIFPALDACPKKDLPRRLTFDGLARKYSATMETIADINAPETIRRLHDLEPDIMLSNRFDLIFRTEAINVPRLGLFNLHPGALPQYRGLYAPFRALVNGESRMGCTLHAIDPGIDTGPVMDIAWINADRSKSVFWHYVQLYMGGADIFAELMTKLEDGQEIKATPQQEAEATYYKYPSSEELEAFRRAGGKLFDTLEYREILSTYR
ncbi:formyltransferase family protein [Desulfovibrio ferrophilus]|uniref:Predicted methionyl-tRNA formyltransferase n=1 Tax=Desulfovibrio ferrophilus TaxID=241368 RepID=A0A2Z6AYB6_9BACT|nr:formyltransferase family protein [Desulfovibrio ferrophilus]BBD08252.1 predicted methionyl-tRNA formyltransferase [Desulfovibrio ferrophilus]